MKKTTKSARRPRLQPMPKWLKVGALVCRSKRSRIGSVWMVDEVIVDSVLGWSFRAFQLRLHKGVNRTQVMYGRQERGKLLWVQYKGDATRFGIGGAK